MLTVTITTSLVCKRAAYFRYINGKKKLTMENFKELEGWFETCRIQMNAC